MKLSDFLRQLQSEGRLVFDSPDPPGNDPEQEAECARLIEELDRRRRLEMAFAPPALDVATALWSARLLYRAAQFLVFRDCGEELVREDLLSSECPGKPGPQRLYSADLCLCWLPELHRRARRVSMRDALTDCLAELGRRWPLSSVGMKLSPPDGGWELDDFWDQASLRTLYLDRVISRKDSSRLADERVAAAVRDAVAHRADLSRWAAAVDP